MRKITFKDIQMQNFLSVGDEIVHLKYNSGLNIITGANLDKEDSGNGIGKSTILEAIYFALFGDTLRELKADQIKHYGAGGKCTVTLRFDIDSPSGVKSYKIVRNAGPSKVKISEDKHDITPSTIAKTNSFIQSLIQSTPEVFHNSVIMTANNAVPFMSQRKGDKRKFLEGILGLGVFGDMLGLARQEFNDAKQEHSVEYARYQTQLTTYTTQKDRFEVYTNKKTDKLADLQARIVDHEEEASKLNDELVELEKQLDNIASEKSTEDVDKLIEEQRDEHTRIIHTIAKLTHSMENSQAIIDEIEALPDVCTSCNRPLTQKLKADSIKRSKAQYKNIESISKDIDEANTQVEIIDSNLKKLYAARDLIYR